MRRVITTARPERRPQTLRLVARAKTVPRTVTRADIAVQKKRLPAREVRPQPSSGFQPDPYVDYGRFLTPEGGILLIYKDVDVRFRHTLWRLFAWIFFTGIEASYLRAAPVESLLIKITCFAVIAVVNWLIVKKPVEVYRRLEIRPDCMIVEGSDIFWTRFMECGFPSLRPGADGTQILSGIYGTRAVDYLTIRRFDEHDRMSQVFAAHLQNAMQQQWNRPR